MNISARASVGIGLVGSQFISSIHARSLQQCQRAAMLGVCSPTPGNAEKFASEFDIPHHFTDHRKMFERDDIDMVVIGAPNHVHCQLVCDAAAAGKHIVLEKPMCLSLAEADRMMAACSKANVKLMYAEELCFTPKYVRLKQLLESGALGTPTCCMAMPLKPTAVKGTNMPWRRPAARKAGRLRFTRRNGTTASGARCGISSNALRMTCSQR